MKKRNKYILFFLALFLSLIVLFLISLFKKDLQVIACNVGQGDAILIQLGGVQILNDAGAGSEVLDCLSRYMPFWDKNIDLFILSHSDLDHFGGLTSVLKHYKINTLLTSGIESSSPEFRLLESVLGSSETDILYSSTSTTMRLGEIYLDIVYPSKNSLSQMNPNTKSSDDEGLSRYSAVDDQNHYSIIGLLSYKDFDVLLTGDIDPAASNEVALSPIFNGRKIEYLKVPHHGSKNGLTENLLGQILPQVAVISAGRDNRYGHPHKEILDMLEDSKVKILRTDEMGDVVIKTNGRVWWIEN